MKDYRIYFAVAILVLASLACQALSRGDNGNMLKSDFPMTEDAYNITENGDGSVLYFTKMSLEEIMEFYRTEYASKGYKERELLTAVSDRTISMVFDGDPSGKSVVIQSVDFGDGSCSVAIRLEDT